MGKRNKNYGYEFSEDHPTDDKVYINGSDLVKVLDKILNDHYKRALTQEVAEAAQIEVVKRVMSEEIESYIHGIVNRAVMDAVGRLIASRIKVDVSLLKLEGDG